MYLCVYLCNYTVLSFLPARPKVTPVVLQWAMSTAEGHFWSLHAASTRLILLSLIISSWIIQASLYFPVSTLPLYHLFPSWLSLLQKAQNDKIESLNLPVLPLSRGSLNSWLVKEVWRKWWRKAVLSKRCDSVLVGVTFVFKNNPRSFHLVLCSCSMS